MAKAEKIVAVPASEIRLTLTRAEAETLRAICNQIGGDAARTRRAHADSVSAALQSIGVENNTSDICPRNRVIYFIDPKNI